MSIVRHINHEYTYKMFQHYPTNQISPTMQNRPLNSFIKQLNSRHKMAEHPSICHTVSPGPSKQRRHLTVYSLIYLKAKTHLFQYLIQQK
jgi:hypothetical protein